MNELQRLRIVLFLTPGCAPGIIRELRAVASVRFVEKDVEAALALLGGAQLLVTDKECWSRMSTQVRRTLRERRKAGQAKIIVISDRGIKSTLTHVHDIDLVLAFDESPQRLTESLNRLMVSLNLDYQLPVPGPAPVLLPVSKVRSLLIIDDSVLNNRIVTAVLTQAGYQVTCLTGPFEMHKRVREQTPDLVLVDYNMPALRGDQLIEINVRAGLTIPMVLYSNAPQPELAAAAKKCGAIGYIVKGVSGEALLDQIDRVYASLARTRGQLPQTSR